ncbi:hypothetical protein HDU84_008842 [Entophlyctis sp. JEL0112]|nr:hypothetical protein HDU84_008842 [Entophlyctis sp. JEL0112]
MAAPVVPFRVAVPDDAVADLLHRIENARVPESIDGDAATSKNGISQNTLRALLDRWTTGFDWSAQQTLLNTLPMFTTDVDDTSIHFVHLTSHRADARPIILVHGWPGSFFEFHKIVAQLANPSDPTHPAFHVVVPSIPGFGFSPSPGGRIEKLSVDWIADIFVNLMRNLGYSRFFAQAGDWGSMITKKMAIRHPKSCVAIHLNLAIAPLPTSISYLPQRVLLSINPSLVLTAVEMAGVEKTLKWAKHETAYFKIQGTKPYSLGVGLNDSPVGLLAWIGEKMHWEGMDPDELLTNVCIYWFTQTITSSFRIYRDNLHDSMDATFVPVPTAVAIFDDIYQPPQQWMRYVCNLKRFTRMERGGHFAALEVPDLLLSDMRKYFGWKEIANCIPVRPNKGKSKL